MLIKRGKPWGYEEDHLGGGEKAFKGRERKDLTREGKNEGLFLWKEEPGVVREFSLIHGPAERNNNTIRAVSKVKKKDISGGPGVSGRQTMVWGLHEFLLNS